jgi:deoxyinosine 3'endonuclease (endonuclease V)
LVDRIAALPGCERLRIVDGVVSDTMMAEKRGGVPCHSGFTTKVAVVGVTEAMRYGPPERSISGSGSTQVLEPATVDAGIKGLKRSLHPDAGLENRTSMEPF